MGSFTQLYVIQRIKLSREFISIFLKDAIPEYEEILLSIEKDGGWPTPPPKLIDWIDKLKAYDYPMFYTGENTLTKALLLAFMSAEEINKLSAKIESIPESERIGFTENLVTSLKDATDTILDSFPDSPEKELVA